MKYSWWSEQRGINTLLPLAESDTYVMRTEAVLKYAVCIRLTFGWFQLQVNWQINHHVTNPIYNFI